MSLFQKSVLNKHLKAQDEQKVVAAFEKLKVYQSDKEHIKEYNEEVFQDGFLKEIFVDVFGYKLNTIDKDNYNLVREKKNVSDSKKADGAILKEGEVFCVIELKDTTTKDLTKVETQAFGYQSGHTNCNYVIISNFEKLNFYIKNKVDKIEFNLFTATLEEFKTIYLCLHADNLLTDVPLKVKEASLVEDEKVTKGLYKDYSAFKNALWENLCNNHPEEDKLFLFKKTQKLLDRFLFIFFGEDKGLLPPNSISKIITQWEQLKELDEYKPLYERFKKYFGYLNTGWKGKEYEIFAYNGGLFFSDELLDKIQIDDNVLHPHVMKLTAYDFDSDVDVNILGHIFEHSLNEIENITAQLEGKEVDKGKTKRKKDGVFYTPKYITKYIVENTVGKLCAEKKEELDIADEEYAKGRKNRKKETIKTLDKNLQAYRNWLLQITICDPACGSGAFLNQALEFLMQEHQFIDELESQLLGHSFEFPGVENHILENNLFGVDINEESVEIAKLSLWLRTAQKGRKLTSLNNNIKCGNSLVDDLEVAGDKAFSWDKEFVRVFEKGGFDVVIGNPPYVSIETLLHFDRELVNYLNISYKKDLTGHWDLFICFISLSIRILKTKGLNSFILPSTLLNEKYCQKIRENIINEYELLEIVDFGEKIIFQNVARQTMIYNLRKLNNPSNFVIIKSDLTNKYTTVPQVFFKKLKNTKFKTELNEVDIKIYNKIRSKTQKLGEFYCVNVGVVANSSKNSPIKFKKDDVVYKTYKSGFKKYIEGSNLSRYSLIYKDQYLDYDTNKNYFHRPKYKLLFESEKIIIRVISGVNNSILAYLDVNQYYTNHSMLHIMRWSDNILQHQKPEKKWTIDCDLKLNNWFILSLLCSKLMTYFFKMFLSTDSLQGTYTSINSEDLREFPIVIVTDSSQNLLIKLAKNMQELNNSYQIEIKLFQQYFTTKYKLEKLSKKLQNWHQLEFGDFIKELNKAIKKVGGEKLSKMDEMDWMEVFETKKKEAQKLKSEIDKTDKEIDAMVYKLYDLTDEEIQIVENS